MSSRLEQLGNLRGAMLSLVQALDRRGGEASQRRYWAGELARLACMQDLPPGVLDAELRRRICAAPHLRPAERAAVARAADAPLAGQVGAVTCALVTTQAPHEAFVRRLRIVRTDEELAGDCFPAGFGPGLRRCLLDACKLMQDHLQRCWFAVPLDVQARHRFELEQGPPVELEGRSLGAAAAVAFFSLWTGVEVPATVAVVAGVEPGPDGHGALGPTDAAALELKVAALAQERPHLRRVVLPAEQLGAVDPRHIGRLVPARGLEQLLDAALGPGYEARVVVPAGIDLDNEVRRAEADYRAGHDRRSWASKARRFEVLARALPETEASARARCRCLAYGASCLLHMGETALARPMLKQAQALFERFADTSDWSFLPWVLDRVAMSQLDLYAVEAALDSARLALQRATELRLDLESCSKLHGTLGQILLAAGEHQAAIVELEAALDGIHRVRPAECVRNHTYLVRAHGAAGDYEAARLAFEAALEHAGRAHQDSRLTNDAYLRYAMAGVWLARDRPAEAAQLLAQLPFDALDKLGPIEARIHKLLVRARLLLGQDAAAHEHLRAVQRWVRTAPSARLRWLQATAELELAQVLLERHGPELELLSRGIERALDCIPQEPDARQHFGPAVEQVRSALAGGPDPGALARAVRGLLERELY